MSHESCECAIYRFPKDRGKHRLVFCPLHAAASKLLDTLIDLTALYEASPGRDPHFVKKARAVIHAAQIG